MAPPSPSAEVGKLAQGVRDGERSVLSRAITLTESKRADHRRTATALTQALLGLTGKAIRVGITGAPGGVAAKTRETLLLCEAAGYDVILVETVGVGQSEIAVADMTDFFLVLMLPGAGDELQGLKKGVVELADMIAVNKADGDNIARARAAAAEYRAPLHILSPRSPHWSPPVVTYSALTRDGIAQMWALVLEHKDKLSAAGEIATRRGEQQVKWMWEM